MTVGRNGEICVVKRQKSDIIRVERENVYMRDETKIDLYAASAISREYDEACKRIFRNKEIIAPIMQMVVPGGIFFGFHECMMGICRENYGKKNDNDSGKKVFKTHHKDSFELIGLFFAFYINREQKECKGVVTT